MFDKFGEFDSAEEMNRAAEAQLKEGDLDAIRKIAQENGIDKEDAEDYIDGYTDRLATPLMAAVGKLAVEAEYLKLEGIVKDWKDSIVEYCTDDEKFAIAVRRKGKHLENCLAQLLQFAFENKVRISDKIVDVTDVMHNGKLEKMRKPLYLGIPSRADVKKIVRKYYLE